MVGALSGAGNFSFSDAAVHARVLDAPGISSELDPSTLPPAWVLLVIALVSGMSEDFREAEQGWVKKSAGAAGGQLNARNRIFG